MKTYIHTAAQARDIDKKAIETIGIPSLVLMEHAASGMFLMIQKQYPAAESFCVVCGPGNNGADGLALARLLFQSGKRVTCFADTARVPSAEQAVWRQVIQNLNIPLLPFEKLEGTFDVIVDGLFGSGLSRPLSDTCIRLVETINSMETPVFSIDIPSGLNGTTGTIEGACIRADSTGALDCIKTGELINEGPGVCGKIQCIPISIPEFLHTGFPYEMFVLDKQQAACGLPARRNDSHKGNFGKVLMCGGSLNMQGGLSMAAKACFHAGAGLLTLYTPEKAAMAIASKMDLAMIIPAPETHGFFSEDAALRLAVIKDDYSVIAVGNGMGNGKGAENVCREALLSHKPVVLDADGINVCCRFPILLDRPYSTILTPHVKEFSRISGQSMEDIQKDPIQAAVNFVRQYPFVTLVLKSDTTVICDHSRLAWFSRKDSALSKGGSGDVLCGLITGLAACSSDPFLACMAGVYIHNQAAASAEDPACFTPLDCIRQFPAVFKELRSFS